MVKTERNKEEVKAWGSEGLWETEKHLPVWERDGLHGYGLVGIKNYSHKCVRDS